MASLDLELSDGTTMPQLAFGLYLVDKEECAKVVKEAAKAGYRHFDGAAFYDNEAETGFGLPPDGSAWYTTKVWTTDRTFDDAVASVRRSFLETGGRMLDLALVHWPVPKAHVQMYRALVHCRDELGIVKRLGLSNYTPDDYEELERRKRRGSMDFLEDARRGLRATRVEAARLGRVESSRTREKRFLDRVEQPPWTAHDAGAGLLRTGPPVVNQIEASPLLYRADCVEFFRARGVAIQAFKPLQRGQALANPTVRSVALKLKRTPAQILLKWGVEKGFCVCVKSADPLRMRENLALDFELGAENTALLDDLTTPAALEQWRAHYLARRAGSEAPWGDKPRPALLHAGRILDSRPLAEDVARAEAALSGGLEPFKCDCNACTAMMEQAHLNPEERRRMLEEHNAMATGGDESSIRAVDYGVSQESWDLMTELMKKTEEEAKANGG